MKITVTFEPETADEGVRANTIILSAADCSLVTSRDVIRDSEGRPKRLADSGAFELKARCEGHGFPAWQVT